jgi:hypothetical protein
MTEVEEQRAKSNLDRARQAQRTVNAYHRTFHGPDGQAVIDDLINSFGVNIPAFLPTATRPGEPVKYDPFYAAIRDGQRSVLLHINSKLHARVEGDANLEPEPSLT